MAQQGLEHYPSTVHGLRQWILDSYAQCKTISKDKAHSSTNVFIPASRITQYLGDITRTSRLLNNNQDIHPPVDAQSLMSKCPRTFCILVLINREKYIGHFVHYGGLWDRHLPHTTEPRDFPKDPDFFRKFYHAQWQFCATSLETTTSVNISKELILPIIHKKWLAGGVSADLHHIVIHTEYDSLRDSGQSNTHREFALKTYRGRRADTYFRNEVQNFAQLTVYPSEPCPGLIGFYGGFEHNGTYNLLLEFADCGNLEEHFQNEEPPTSGAEILAFWKSFTEVIKALVKIHELNFDVDDDRGRKVLQGWHQDIKPKNILIHGQDVASPFERKFKLADLGLSHFVRVNGEDGEASAPDTMGTETYGAPELHRRTDFDHTLELNATRAIDIWSLGCVMLEACIWIVRGKSYLEAFRTSRQAAYQSLHQCPGDCFHDGRGRTTKPNLLQTVQQQIQTLQYECRRSDFITENLLKEIKKMLRSWPKERPPIPEIFANIQEHLAEAEKRLKHHDLDRPYSCEATMVLRGTRNVDEEGFAPILPGTPPGSLPEPSAAGRPKSNTIVSFVEPNPDPFFGGKSIYSSPQNSEYHPGVVQTRSATQPQPPFRHAAASAPPPPNFHRYHAPPSAYGPMGPAALNTGGLYGSFGSPTLDHGFPKSSSPIDTIGPSRQSTTATAVTANTHNSPETSKRQLTPVQDSEDAPLGNTPSRSHHEPSLSREEPQKSSSSREEPQSPQTGGSKGAGTPESAKRTSTIVRTSSKRQEQPARKKKKQKKDTPYLKVSRAKGWKAEQKRKFGHKSPLEYGYLRDWLKGRDHIFIVDDSWSMQPYWDHVVDLIDPLAYLVKIGDDDGIELFYTVSPDSRKSKNSSDITNAVSAHKPDGNTDISIRLGKILRSTQEKIYNQTTRGGRVATPVSIYVLTDGVWAGGHDAKTAIKETIKVLKKYNYRRKQIGIQFISFGDDPTALERLEELDDFGKLDEVGEDVVDTENSQGNVWKMLLGSIDQTFDDAENSDEGE